jgi:hypothetical protein
MAPVIVRTPSELQRLVHEQAEETKEVLNRIASSDEFEDLDYRVLASIFYEACHLNPCAQHIIGNLCERCAELTLAEGWFALASELGYDPSRQRLLEMRPRAA